METLRNIINPGKDKDDEIMYGSGTKATVSHIERAPQTTTTPPQRPAEADQRTEADRPLETATGPRSSDVENKAVSDVGSGRNVPPQTRPEPRDSTTDQGNSFASRPATQRMLPDDDASTASIKSGIAGRPPRSTLTGSAATGSNLTADTNQPSKTIGTEGRGTERAFPLSGSTTNEPTSTTDTAQRDQSHKEHKERNAGSGGGILSFLYRHEHGGHGHRFEGDPCGPETAKQSEGLFAPGPHATDTANRLDPQLSSGQARQGTGVSEGAIPATESGQESKHHYGRDAAMAGAGAAAAGGAYKAGHQDPSTTTGPASKTIGPHVSNIANVADPRVQPDPAKMKGEHTSAGVTPGSESKETHPHEKEQGGHHFGRDAALVGTGAAVAGGTYEAGHQDPSTTTGPASNTIGPHSSDVANVADPRVQPDPAKMKGEYAGGPKGPHAYAGNEGATTAAGDTYRAGDADPSMTTGPASKTHGRHSSNWANILDPRVLPDPQKMKGKNAGANEENPYSRTPVDSRVDYDNKAAQRNEPGETHHDRDAAAVGGAAAGATAAHEFSKHDAEKAEKQRLKDKEKYEKQMAKEEKHREKELQKAHKHDAEKTQKHMTKEEKHHEPEEEKHGRRRSILGFFKRDKTDDELKQEEAERKEHERTGAEVAGAAGVTTGAGMAAREHEQNEGRNRLHKEPPTGYTTQEKRTSPNEADQQTTPATGASQTATATATGPGAGAAASKASGATGSEGAEQEGIVKEPYTGLPMNVGKYGTTGTGGTDAGNVAGAERTTDARQFGAEPSAKPAEEKREDKIVTEPYTGLPMNIGKYGTTGAGGVDAGPFPGAERTEDVRALGVEPPAPQGEESREDKFVNEPHTERPMNVGKNGTTGAGGVDAGPFPRAERTEEERTENVRNLGVEAPSSTTGASGAAGTGSTSGAYRMPGAYETQD
ncbi:hypothetical protein L228DRAFT_237060 [Xylona heveae TC161]|uniref:Uncharacterized protein n=1 Tax=Xylona heveae (strain CBS 132557 / TC161) TaxID=1328760 RepID=A0A165HYC5_XYLHT|nr:hypothetical protein L228DRAFT_237060 [Xylona heveae TC161]KZF24098.1 hypothetical protein L228DRAFT_237060 [Xylona heveae TC161]